MGFTAISRFEVRNKMEDEVRIAFKNRPRLVEKVVGFVVLYSLGRRRVIPSLVQK